MRMNESLQNETASSALENKETKDLIQKVFDDLPEKFRTALDLHILQGVTFEELGKILGMSHSSAHRLVTEAKDVLGKQLKSAGISSLSVVSVVESVGQNTATAPAPLAQTLCQTLSSQPRVLASVKPAFPRAFGKVVALAACFAAVVAGSIWWLQPPAAPAANAPQKEITADKNGSSKAAVAKKTDANDDTTAKNPLPDIGRILFHCNFNDGKLPPELKIIKGALRFSPTDGKDGSACLELDSFTQIYIDLPIEELPVKVVCEANPSSKSDGAFRVSTAWSNPIRFAFLRNIGELHGLNHLKQDNWCEYVTFVHSNILDQWVNQKRSSLNYAVRQDEKDRLVLVTSGPILLDNLTVYGIKTNESPDISAFAAAVEAIPPEKRTGKVLLPQFRSMRPPEPVYAEFMIENK